MRNILSLFILVFIVGIGTGFSQAEISFPEQDVGVLDESSVQLPGEGVALLQLYTDPVQHSQNLNSVMESKNYVTTEAVYMDLQSDNAEWIKAESNLFTQQDPVPDIHIVDSFYDKSNYILVPKAPDGFKIRIEYVPLE